MSLHRACCCNQLGGLIVPGFPIYPIDFRLNGDWLYPGTPFVENSAGGPSWTDTQEFNEKYGALYYNGDVDNGDVEYAERNGEFGTSFQKYRLGITYGPYNTGAYALAYNPDGIPGVVYAGLYNTTSPYQSRCVYCQLINGVWNKIEIPRTGLPDPNPNNTSVMHAAPGLAYRSNGNPVVVFVYKYTLGTTNNWIICVAEKNNGVWGIENVANITSRMNNGWTYINPLKIAIAPDDTVHITISTCYTNGYDAQHPNKSEITHMYKPSGGSWQAGILFTWTQPADNYVTAVIGRANITIDSNNKYHIGYGIEYNRNGYTRLIMKYISNKSGSMVGETIWDSNDMVDGFGGLKGIMNNTDIMLIADNPIMIYSRWDGVDLDNTYPCISYYNNSEWQHYPHTTDNPGGIGYSMVIPGCHKQNQF